jgi:DNA polymerase-4
VADVAQVPPDALAAVLGRAAGHHLHALAHNLDPRPVHTAGRRRSIGSQSAHGRRPRSDQEIDAVLLALVDRVTRRLRGAGRVGRTVTLRLRFGDFARATRSHTLIESTANTATILAAARELLRAAAPLIEEHGLTLIGLAVSNLDDDRAVQLVLPFDQRCTGGLDATLDDVRRRFGTKAVTRAALLGRDLNPSVPLLPD